MSFQLSDPCVCAKISGIVTGQTLQVLPVHIILGNSECRRITIPKPKRAGREWGPVATYTKMVFTQTSSVNYKELCKLDVLGLADLPTGDQAVVSSRKSCREGTRDGTRHYYRGKREPLFLGN